MTTFSEKLKLAGGTTGTLHVAASGATDSSRGLDQFARVSVGVQNGITNGVTFTLEGSVDGLNWVTIAYGTGSTASYTKAALTVAAGAYALLFLPPDDYVRYVRANVSAGNAVGTTFTVYGAGV